MPTDSDPDLETTSAPEPAPEEQAGSPVRRSVLRAVRRLVTPIAIVVAWIVVVTQWNESDDALFNWATTTAAIVLGVVSILWLVSLRFPALRRALLPFEGGLVVGAVVLAAATRGREVDVLGDRIAIAFVFGVIAIILLAFVQQLVAGRDRANAWLAGIVVICAVAGIAVPATLDWLEGSEPMEFDGELVGEVMGRTSGEGFRLDDISMQYSAPALGGGYVDAGAVYETAYPAAPMVDPMTGLAPVPAPVDPMLEGGTAIPTVRNDWAQLLAQPDGSIEFVVQPAVAMGVKGGVQASVRRGTCRDVADAKELLSLRIRRPSGTDLQRTLPITVDDLRIDDELSVVVGTAKPLAPTRCVELLSPSGVALAQLGAADFADECIEPLDLPRGSEYLVRASSFQDPACAARFEEYADISASLLFAPDKVEAYRDCRRQNEPGMVATERKLARRAIAVRYDDFNYGPCVIHAANATTYGVGFATGSTGPAVAYATSVPVPMPAVPASPMAPVAPVGAAPVAGVAPAAPDATLTEDLDGMTPEELATKIR